MSERILLIKIVALGDAVMASTLVPAIRRRWPGATIGWAAGRGIAPFVRLVDGVDEVIEVDEQMLLGGSRPAAVAAVLGAWRRIGRRWDRVFVCHTDKRYAILSWLAGAHSVTRFAGANAPRANRWMGAEYMRLVDSAAARSDNAPGALSGADALPSIKVSALPIPARVPGHGPLVVVAPGGARNLLRDDHLRRWPLASWTATVERLVHLGCRVVAVGSKADGPECAACARVGALDYSGATTVPELMSVLHAADLVITHDSGSLHLSIALKRPVIALFGPTSPVQFVPSGANVTVLTRASGLACAPCYNGTGYAPCASNLCLSRVPGFEVAMTAETILSGTTPAMQRVSQ